MAPVEASCAQREAVQSRLAATNRSGRYGQPGIDSLRVLLFLAGGGRIPQSSLVPPTKGDPSAMDLFLHFTLGRVGTMNHGGGPSAPSGPGGCTMPTDSRNRCCL